MYYYYYYYQQQQQPDVSAANAICKETDSLNRGKITNLLILKHLLHLA
jgi:hypothetical protein